MRERPGEVCTEDRKAFDAGGGLYDGEVLKSSSRGIGRAKVLLIKLAEAILRHKMYQLLEYIQIALEEQLRGCFGRPCALLDCLCEAIAGELECSKEFDPGKSWGAGVAHGPPEAAYEISVLQILTACAVLVCARWYGFEAEHSGIFASAVGELVWQVDFGKNVGRFVWLSGGVLVVGIT